MNELDFENEDYRILNSTDCTELPEEEAQLRSYVQNLLGDSGREGWY
jgi:hypothetical protein